MKPLLFYFCLLFFFILFHLSLKHTRIKRKKRKYCYGNSPIHIPNSSLLCYCPWPCLHHSMHSCWIQENKGLFYVLYPHTSLEPNLFIFFGFLCVFVFNLQKKDLRFDGKLCYLPGSVAFELGIGALICLLMAQVIGNLMICRIFFSRDSWKAKKNPTLLINGFICLLSWYVGDPSISNMQFYKSSTL